MAHHILSRLVTALAVTSVAGYTTATLPPDLTFNPLDPDHRWQAPGPNDIRSSCPGMNILANYGYINRNGSDISGESAILAQMRVFNVERLRATLPVNVSLGLTSTGDPTTFNLIDLAVAPQDQDGKMARNDMALGDTVPFNRTIWDSVLAKWPDNLVTWQVAAASRNARFAEAAAENPQFDLGGPQGRNYNLSLTRWALALQSFGRSIEDGGSRKDWINISFVEERLPFVEGWWPSDTVVLNSDVAKIAAGIRALS